MRAQCVYDLATGRWLRVGYVGLAYNPAVEGMVELDAIPDVTAEVFDATSPTWTRRATPEELAAFLAAHRAETADGAVADAATRTTIIWTLSRMLGHAPTPAEIQAAAVEWRAIYRQQPGVR
jgi:hypothetical protein